MQKNDTHIQNLINKAKQEEPVIPKEFARTLLEKQALQASAMSNINKGTKMLNTISIASMAASVAMLMNTITTSNINKNEVSKIKEQNPKEQIIVQKNDVAQVKNSNSDMKIAESVENNPTESIDDVQVRIYKIETVNKTAPIKQIFPTKQVMPSTQTLADNQITLSNKTNYDNKVISDSKIIASQRTPSAENNLLAANKPETKQINQNKTTTENPIDIVGINPIKLTKDEIAKLGFVVEKGGHLSYYNSFGENNKKYLKNTIQFPWSFNLSIIEGNEISAISQLPTNPKHKVISNQDGGEKISFFYTQSVPYNNYGSKEILSSFSAPNTMNKLEPKINNIAFQSKICTRSIDTDLNDSLSNNPQIKKIIEDALINNKLNPFSAGSISVSTDNEGNDALLSEGTNLNIEINRMVSEFRSKIPNGITDTNNSSFVKFVKFGTDSSFSYQNPNTDVSVITIMDDQMNSYDDVLTQTTINLNELLPIEVEMIDNNGEPLYADGKLQTLIIWFEPTMEFIEKLPEQIKRKLSPELEAIPNDYETCPTPPVTGGQPHFDVWRACSGAVENLKTYPTPVEDVLHFKYTLAEDRQISMYVCNLNGEVIANPIKYENYRKGCVEDQINVGYLNSGMYLLVISSETGEKAVQRFLVK